MNLQRTCALACLASALPTAEASISGLTDPKLCYILDGILLIYGIIITALYFKDKFSKPKEGPQTDPIYSDLDKSRDQYDQLRRGHDAESGGARPNRRQADDVYTPLQKPTTDSYDQIAVKQNRERRRNKEQVYQGLSAATKDTYDSLNMQPLPPR
ncbi:T-cell surface glycoprotein CD3 zeta chain [Amia ocellicauda]|uniref:T-cell surface glycoprotein CD3 zeta chain n=1 Tax=Amia ocellicauda TaxID=2972642 RepID=UPI0034641911